MRWRNQSYVVLGQENVFGFLIDFIYENDLVALGEKFAKKKGTDSHLSDGDPFEKKLNAHGVKIDFFGFFVNLTK